MVRAQLDNFDDPGTGPHYEQLWAERVGANLVELTCIPFFTYGMALNDILEISDTYDVIAVHRRSGHRVARVGLEHGPSEARLRFHLGMVAEDLGLRAEWYGSRYLAIDIPPESESILRELWRQLTSIEDQIQYELVPGPDA